ncbi:hypothetical protein Asulf_00956 [Archaeoglobus sulfaticallidus PM70-1]|uniref:Uncharacterized protein n=1 Tax=Archaeoglobus sulfaticallidus PM70-1 TaxID=387631 RepID=N0BL85_9EURY|nr:hypothetical protein [Archaeoglobus sulfaticallidus]AGK60960.1 hypothetical protein Asulf_00956 [Archaeoglobus sulfaticallidus PM70-1]
MVSNIEKEKNNRYLDILNKYASVIAIFSAFMVAGSFLIDTTYFKNATNEDSNPFNKTFALVGAFLFVSGFAGIFLVLVDSLAKYLDRFEKLQKMLSFISVVLLSGIATVTFFSIYYLIKTAYNSKDLLSLSFKLFGVMTYIAFLFVTFMIFHFEPLYEWVKPRIKQRLSKLKKRQKR